MQKCHKLNPDQAKALQQAWKEGKYSSKVDQAKAFCISRQAVYRYLKFIHSLYPAGPAAILIRIWDAHPSLL